MFGFRRGGEPAKVKNPMSPATKRYFILLFAFAFVLFSSMIIGSWLVAAIVPNYSEQLYTNYASISMLLVSFFVGIVAWQGVRVLGVILWLLSRLITFGMIESKPPTQSIRPPNAWKMVPYSMLVCTIYGLIIGIANPDVQIITALDFGIAGAAWGVLLIFLAQFRLLPFAKVEVVEEYLEDYDFEYDE